MWRSLPQIPAARTRTRTPSPATRAGRSTTSTRFPLARTARIPRSLRQPGARVSLPRSRPEDRMAAAAQQAPTSPFLDPALMEDPYPVLARLRAEDPVHFVAPLGFWLILRHDDVKRLFNDPEYATPDRRLWEHFVPRPEGSFMRWVEDNGFFSLPADEHTRLRKLFSAALTPRAVKRYEAQVRETVERFAAPLR